MPDENEDTAFTQAEFWINATICVEYYTHKKTWKCIVCITTLFLNYFM